MTRSRLAAFVAVALLSTLIVAALAQDTQPSLSVAIHAPQLMRDGNWKEAYDAFSQLTLDGNIDQTKAPEYFDSALTCVRNLGDLTGIDDFREKVVAGHPENWRLVAAVANSYMQIDHEGYIVAGKFNRGYARNGQVKYVNALERDRVRALQLLGLAREQSAGDADKPAVARVWIDTANALLADRGYAEAWRLQYLTDLSVLPDYEEGYSYGYNGPRAPVDAAGQPVFHSTPASWKDAHTDGARWRWALAQAMTIDPARTGYVRFIFASFLDAQFGVQTMADYGWFFGRLTTDDDTPKNDSGTWDLSNLGDDETIARLANGIKRFKLADEFNYLKIFKDLADNRSYDHQPREALARIYENRRQYVKAAQQWRLAIKEYGPGDQNYRQNALDQIVGNWGMFEPVMTQAAGDKGATVDFRFRNGDKVAFEATRIDVQKLLNDVKGFIKTHDQAPDWWVKIDVSNIGYRLVQDDQTRYLTHERQKWELDLKPRPEHVDARVTVQTPLTKAGAYLLRARMADGNVSNVIIWVADTAIVKKTLDHGGYVYVADAITGAPIPNADVEFFGYWMEWKDNRSIVHTRDFAEKTDADGQVIVKPGADATNYTWLITATTGDGRLAYLGYSGLWGGHSYDPEYNQTKTFVITDRPVYRPGQTIKYKFWVNTAKYDLEGKSEYAGKTFTVQVYDPKNEKVKEATFTADDYGGFNGELVLDKDATLGTYTLQCWGGSGSFRLEEYKKPEFEVKVEAPTEPAMLGEKIAAKVTARYYFGAPVTEAKIAYKVLRSSYSADWYPLGRWDWFYGPGYWWFACDYPWYPGWGDWGCARPMPIWWWRWHPQAQPEVVAEGDAPLGKDGTFNIEIDTALAKAVHGDTDHKYEITAEVTDASRRTIVGTGSVLVARKPFKVYAWVDRGHYRAGDVVHADFFAQTLDNKPVPGKGELTLFKISYDKDHQPVEKSVGQWDLPTDAQGQCQQRIKAGQPGQYRLSYTVTDAKGHAIEGGYIFLVTGEGAGDFRFNDIELVQDKKEYQPGDKVDLLINADRPASTVLLFERPTDGTYLPPKILRLHGKSTREAIDVAKRDMPNFFVEALTVSGGKVFTDVKEIVVPPQSRVLDVKVTPSSDKYKPGEKAKVAIQLTGPDGRPFIGSTVVAIYDKAVEYISGGSNVPEIREFFWKWRRSHQPITESSLDKGGGNIIKSGQIAMGFLGTFGADVVEEFRDSGRHEESRGALRIQVTADVVDANFAAAPGAAMNDRAANGLIGGATGYGFHGFAATQPDAPGGPAPLVEPTVRQNFADTALWIAALTTDAAGQATAELTMPENLTTWKARVWAMGPGTRVGEATAEMITTKNLIIRLQAPRFFTQKDEVVLSANVHNYLKTAKRVQVALELEGNTLEPLEGVALVQSAIVEADGEARVDWRVKAVQPGNAVVRMKALTDEESDATQQEFPVFIHGMLKTDSWSGVIRPDKESASVTITVPAERLPEQTRLEVRYSPTLAGAMVDALPYMVDYPYDCTEQTLDRFLPTVVTQNVLLKMGLDLKDIQKKRVNLNAQEIGADAERAHDWAYRGGYMSRPTADVKNAVFDPDEVKSMVKAGLEKLLAMQCSDGGWGWFSGTGEVSWAHTTALVVHGLQLAKENDVALVPGMLERGVAWLRAYQVDQLKFLDHPDLKEKQKADNLDAFVNMVLTDQAVAERKPQTAEDARMKDYLYRDRNDLAVYAKAMFGLALHRVGDVARRDMLLRNIEQFLQQDEENQTAWLKLPEDNWWWCWYGSETEAQAYYLKLLCAVEPQAPQTSRLVKYLINNRKHASYWNSTRDTAIAVEAFADYLRASGEDKPDMTVSVLLDGRPVKEGVKIDAANLFSFDNKLMLEGTAVTSGPHTVELVKKGTGPLYFNAYLTNFTLEDPITSAGLEIKVQRKFYKLVAVDKKIKVSGSQGQVLDQKVEKYDRQPLADGATLASGDLVEVELTIDSKNDYEYVMFSDMLAAGFVPVEVRSGYNGNDMGAYMELRDERVTFFVRELPRGTRSVSYRLRAEIPGKFSALPAKAAAMYAPELKANSDEFKIGITD